MSEISPESWPALLARLQQGEKAARDELLARTYVRLRQLMGRLISKFPVVQEHAGATDVLHDTFLRLSRALETMSPRSPGEFFGLSALHMRRQLMDMARKLRRQPDLRPLQPAGDSHNSDRAGPSESGESTLDPAVLERWSEFHRQVDHLPEDERTVFDLLYYHNLSQAEAAQTLGVSIPTIKRRWAAARMRLALYLEDRSL